MIVYMCVCLLEIYLFCLPWTILIHVYPTSFGIIKYHTYYFFHIHTYIYRSSFTIKSPNIGYHQARTNTMSCQFICCSRMAVYQHAPHTKKHAPSYITHCHILETIKFQLPSSNLMSHFIIFHASSFSMYQQTYLYLMFLYFYASNIIYRVPNSLSIRHIIIHHSHLHA